VKLDIRMSSPGHLCGGEKGKKKNEGYGVAGGEELLTCGRST
jgi:hypothetical protein